MRLHLRAPPSAGLRAGAYLRHGGSRVRLAAAAQGLVQQTEPGARGALALRGRVDRPTRLGPDVTLIPALTVRGFLQPRDSLDWLWGEADMEIASSYRAHHPIGLGAGALLHWRPWADAEILVGVDATSNADVVTLDNAGGDLRFRASPRWFGVEAGVDLSWRLADAWRTTATLRWELHLDLWADLGPPALWVVPRVHMAYLPRPNRVELVVGATVIPGARSLVHLHPVAMPLDDVRQPLLEDGRWRR